MEWVIVVAVVLMLGLVAVVATGRFGAMPQTADRDIYIPVLPDRTLTADDLDTVRFGVTLRGYAMEQVDELLDRLSFELTERDRQIAELREENDSLLAAEGFAHYDLDGGQGVPSSGAWYDGDTMLKDSEPEESPAEVEPEAPESEVEGEPEASAEPEAGEEPEASEEPLLDEESQAEEPVVTDEPEAVDDPVVAEEPEVADEAEEPEPATKTEER